MRWTRRRPLAAVLAAALALLAGPAAAEFVGHGGPVRGLALTPDGHTLLSASFDYSVIRWNLETGAAEAVLYGHDAAVNAVAPVPGGFVSASDDGSLALWSFDRATPVRRLTGHAGRVVALAVSPDGRRAASAAWDRSVRLWDLETGAAIRTLEGHRGPVDAVAFTPDGTLLASAGADGTVRLWRVADGTALATLAGSGTAIHALALSPDGTRLAAAGADGAVRIWPLPGGRAAAPGPETGPETVLTAPVPGPLLALAWSGPHLAATGIDGAVTVWQGQAVRWRLGGDRGPLWAVAFSADGGTVLAGGTDRMIRQWSLETGRERDAPVAVRALPAEAGLPADPVGERLWKRCSACHTLTPDGGNRAGPTLYGVIGRPMGAVPGYPYSPAFRSGHIVWTEAAIDDLFARGPDTVTPGTKMPVQTIPDPAERAALIAFIKRAGAGR
ncbi:c-type cytochrome [Oleisolibacter albus]|uniref:c-type cytochrome n=1 Tax=Oleisolibacter albus TaxID=2171757 RepID=UPI001961E564|nr:c-type cytochrome [Oleisolibacter albus]